MTMPLPSDGAGTVEAAGRAATASWRDARAPSAPARTVPVPRAALGRRVPTCSRRSTSCRSPGAPRSRSRIRPADALAGVPARASPARPAALPEIDEPSRHPSLPAPLAPQLLGRRRLLPAGLLHDEVQPQDQRVGGPPAGLRGAPPAGAGRPRTRDARADVAAAATAGRDQRLPGRLPAASRGRPRRAHRHPRHPRLPPRPRRPRAGRGHRARLVARHEPGDRLHGRLPHRDHRLARRTAAWTSTRCARPSDRAAPPSCSPTPRRSGSSSGTSSSSSRPCTRPAPWPTWTAPT